MDISSGRRFREWFVFGSVAVFLVATLSLPQASAQASAETCFGQPVTVSIAAGERPTKGDDVILGTDGGDYINGKAGNDLICGLGGDDFITGARGKDRIRGGSGNDTLMGGNGFDRLFGGPGNDTLIAGQGAGRLNGGQGADDCAGSEKSSKCEPHCLAKHDLPERITATRAYLTITNSNDQDCHFGSGGLRLFKVVEIDRGNSRSIDIKHLDSAQSDAQVLSPVPGIAAGETLTLTFVNRENRRCAGDGETTKSISYTTREIGFNIDFATTSCGLAYTSSVD